MCCSAECHSADGNLTECHSAESPYAECHSADCHSTKCVGTIKGLPPSTFCGLLKFQINR